MGSWRRRWQFVFCFRIVDEDNGYVKTIAIIFLWKPRMSLDYRTVDVCNRHFLYAWTKRQASYFSSWDSFLVILHLGLYEFSCDSCVPPWTIIYPLSVICESSSMNEFRISCLSVNVTWYELLANTPKRIATNIFIMNNDKHSAYTRRQE